MDSEEYNNISEEFEPIFEVVEYESSEDPPINKWSSLQLDIPEDNQKKILNSQGLYDPGNGELCDDYITMSQTSIHQHPFYNYPAVTDPGIMQALFSPVKPFYYSADGQKLYIDTCKEMGQVPVRLFHQNLINDVIDLSYYCVDPKGVRAMAMAITDNSNVQVLNLTDNFLIDDSCYHLGEMLTYNASLRELNLSRCKIKASGVQRLLKGIGRNRTLKILNLNRNELGDEGVEHLAKAIREAFNVEELYLSYNNISAKGTKALAEAFEIPTKIIKLDLSWNCLFTLEPTYHLLTKLGESDTLQEINLSWNALAGPRIGAAIKMLLKAPNLRYLNLSNNALSGEAITVLSQNIAKANKLISLDLSFNPLSITDTIKVLKKIKAVDIRIQNLLLEGVRVNFEFIELLKAIKALKNVKVIYGDVVPSYKGVGPDIRELVLKRAAYLSRKSKKHRVDFALIILKKIKDGVTLMTSKEFNHHIHSAGVRLDTNLLDTMVSVFSGPSTAKIKRVDLCQIADYVSRLWPDKKLPPTPPPTVEPEPTPKKTKHKLNKKQKRKNAKVKK